jgi:hypothetical protein
MPAYLLGPKSDTTDSHRALTSSRGRCIWGLVVVPRRKRTVVVLAELIFDVWVRFPEQLFRPRVRYPIKGAKAELHS